MREIQTIDFLNLIVIKMITRKIVLVGRKMQPIGIRIMLVD